MMMTQKKDNVHQLTPGEVGTAPLRSKRSLSLKVHHVHREQWDISYT